MDFFGILFDMKNGKKIPYSKSYFDTLFAAKLGGSDVKTLTGTPPLTFTTSETALRSWTIYGNDFQQEESKSTRLPLSFYTDEDKLRDWTIYGNNTPHNYSATGTLPLECTTHTAGNAADWTIYGNAEGVGERTAQLFDGTTIQKGRIDNGVAGYASDTLEAAFENGVITFATTANYRGVYFDPIAIDSAFTFTFSRISGEAAFYFDYYTDDMTYISRNSTNQSSSPITITFSPPQNAKFVRLSIRGISASTYIIADIMLVKGFTAPAEYIPYGYEIPLTINNTPQTFYIGNSPLTAGQSISKTSTGVDISAQVGSNTISTTLYNKPEMLIEGVDYVGVGEPTNDGWQIPLSVSDGTNTTTVNVPIDAPLTAGETATKTSTGVDIPTYVGTNTISTTLENKPTMLVYYGYKGAGVHNGNTWEFNFITSANGNQQLTKITMDKPLRAGKTLTSEQAGVTIPTYADAENTLSLYPNAAGYGNPEMTITYKGG